MNDSLILIISIIVCLGIGFFLGQLITGLKRKSETARLHERLQLKEQQLEGFEKEKADLLKKQEQLQDDKEFFQNELTSRNVAFENLEHRISEKSAELEKLQEKFTKDFEIVANKILEEKSSKFTFQNKENLNLILKPLQEKINSFEKKVEDTNKESLGRHSELRQQIKGLAELNLQMSKDAENLTNALKGDTKMQGNWGELILTRVLEKSGLEKDREYTLQDSHTDETGKRFQTDVLIHLPDGKKMIVDSKVSLTAFERYVSETEDNLKNTFLKQHILSVKNHISTLSSKNYQALLEESPDTIFMFIPIEPAFAIASAHAPQLYEEAFSKNVIIVTPSTLLAALKLVENLWQNDRQKKNAIEIATQAGRLYDSFTLLTDELIKVGTQLGTVQNTYDRTMTKLTGKGNLINRVERLKKLGAKTSKDIDQKLLNSATEDDSIEAAND
ncbi:DNA recombination protein RmuC [Leeuwenhoekiella aestuarii]|uniref:DNA recombination protein RmuC n=1 Tax=Leeuwenhoekiella aestuarii TaxID=2249426 RepID=A0A4Q0NVS7_9FLAO|nr:DNA recombination protein RmuC [Leeuwenhoekiella aestuarii]RXG15648.1 DNA recombination protein RmuC [Leeuwenhoekiella aestuarii]RXG17243.1 DNA recombination protein RmuC [Leeuwenhoekiella aestuarii]